jgi:predicted phage gp36 major capsid-like protein
VTRRTHWLSIEPIPHLFGSNRRPTGERGLHAYWRNGSKVVDADAFRALIGIA